MTSLARLVQGVALLLAAGLAPAAQAARTGGPEVNVSNLPAPQQEPTIAIDPTNPGVLLAGSNSLSEGAMRFYSSTDGGLTWSRDTVYAKPASSQESCAADPGVAVDLSGRQYYSFVRSSPCRAAPPQLFVASREGPAAPWSKPVLVAPLRGSRFDDKPAIAVDASPASAHRNRVYVVWSRLSRRAVFSIVLSRSDDGGRTWSRPVKVNRTGREVTYASVAVSRRGTVYVAWDDVTDFDLKIARSTDGGAHFGPERKVAAFAAVVIPHCGSGIVIPSQRGCVRANPIVSVDASGGRYSGRVYVSYAKIEFRGRQAAHVAVFDSRLRGLAPDRETGEGRAVAPPSRDRPAEQFWPQSAVDRTTGALWVCYYDTRGDPARRQAHYSCTVSGDGGASWAKPVRASSVASDATRPDADARGYGDYEGLVVTNGVAHPIWTDSRDLGTLAEEIYTTRLTLADFRR